MLPLHEDKLIIVSFGSIWTNALIQRRADNSENVTEIFTKNREQGRPILALAILLPTLTQVKKKP